MDQKFPSKLVIFDFDNVLVDGYQIIELARLRMAETLVLSAMNEWQNGTIDLRLAHRKALAYLKGISQKEVENVSRNLILMKNARYTLSTLQEFCKIAVITNGYSQTSSFICKELGIDAIFSNDMIFSDDGLFTGEVRELVPDDNAKREVLCNISQDLQTPLRNIVAIGDGLNDLPMLDLAGFSIGFNTTSAIGQFVDYLINEKDLGKVVDPIKKYFDSIS